MPAITRAAALIGLACATGAVAAPRAQSALECGIAADMAVVAHSLAREEVQRTKADTIMARIYDVSQSDRGKELMKDILDAAYAPPACATTMLSLPADASAATGSAKATATAPAIRVLSITHLQG